MNFYDILLAKKLSGGDAPAPVLITKSVTENGVYSAADDEADGYSSVSVDVPNSYSAGDEGKVVSSGALVSQTTDSTTTNGTVDTTTISSLTVNVPNTYAAGDEGKVVSNGALVSQSSSSTSSNGTVDTTLINSLAISVPTYSAADNGKVVQNGELTAQSTHKSITANGTGIDTTYYSSVDVSVPNSYSAGDEGKVVSNGALVSQTSTTAATNGTINTTTNNSVTISVPNTYTQSDEGKVVSNGSLVSQGSDEVTQNGTVDTTLISSLLVNVASSGATAIKTTVSNGYATNVDVYLVETSNHIYLFGSVTNTSTGAQNFNFIVPDSFDLSKINQFQKGVKAFTGDDNAYMITSSQTYVSTVNKWISVDRFFGNATATIILMYTKKST